MNLAGYHLDLFRGDWRAFLVIHAIGGAGIVAWLALIRSGLNLVLRDPSLTLPQITWATIFIMISAYCIPVLRHEILMLYLLVMIFGAFRLDRAGFLTVDAMAVGGYAAVILALALRHPGEINLAIALVSWLGFAVVATVLSLLGAELSDLRRQIVRQNRQMRIALDRIQEMAQTDELTGISNRRHILELLRYQKALADRGGHPFVVVMLDLDHFKAFNDRFGHGAGDEALRRLAGAMRAGLRQVDRVGRVGARSSCCFWWKPACPTPWAWPSGCAGASKASTSATWPRASGSPPPWGSPPTCPARRSSTPWTGPTAPSTRPSSRAATGWKSPEPPPRQLSLNPGPPPV